PLPLVEVTQFAPPRRHESISNPAGAAVNWFSIHPLLPTQPDFIRVCDAPRSIRDVIDVADAELTLLRELADRRTEKLVKLSANLDPRVTAVGGQGICGFFDHCGIPTLGICLPLLVFQHIFCSAGFLICAHLSVPFVECRAESGRRAIRRGDESLRRAGV